VGNAFVWRGAFLAEMVLNDETASTKILQRKADELLPKLVGQLGEKLPGIIGQPAAAAALPEEHRLPLGVRYATADVLGVKGAGPGAVGYYRDAEQRWRLLSVVCRDEDQAADVLSTLRSVPGATKDKELGDDALRLVHQRTPASPQAEWLVTRVGNAVMGIGDEHLVLRDGMSAAEHRARTLSQDDKRSRLRAWTEQRRGAGKGEEDKK
jgi:hypothetical protein